MTVSPDMTDPTTVRQPRPQRRRPAAAPGATPRARTPPLSVAPMMDRTDRHFRAFLRRITRRTLLYTEMIPVWAVIHGDGERALAHSPEERPLALQLGGDDPAMLADVRPAGRGPGLRRGQPQRRLPERPGPAGQLRCLPHGPARPGRRGGRGDAPGGLDPGDRQAPHRLRRPGPLRGHAPLRRPGRRGRLRPVHGPRPQGLAERPQPEAEPQRPAAPLRGGLPAEGGAAGAGDRDQRRHPHPGRGPGAPGPGRRRGDDRPGRLRRSVLPGGGRPGALRRRLGAEPRRPAGARWSRRWCPTPSGRWRRASRSTTWSATCSACSPAGRARGRGAGT